MSRNWTTNGMEDSQLIGKWESSFIYFFGSYDMGIEFAFNDGDYDTKSKWEEEKIEVKMWNMFDFGKNLGLPKLNFVLKCNFWGPNITFGKLAFDYHFVALAFLFKY